MRKTEEKVLSHIAEAKRPAQKNIPTMSLLDLVLNTLYDNKAEDVVTIELAGKSSIADHMVVASGRSTRQVAAIADKLQKELKQIHGIVATPEGKETGDWVLLDAGDVIIHIFRPEVREFYQLEKMWMSEVATPTTQ